MSKTRPALPPLRAAALALALAGCASTQPAGSSFQLHPHESTALGQGLTLTYDSFSDSRCPPGVHCIWSGKLSYQFILQGQGASETFSLGPGQANYAPAALHGKRIVLDESSIPPPAQAQAALAVPPVTLRVEAR